MLNCTNINSFTVISSDLHQCETGPELMITAAGLAIKHNKDFGELNRSSANGA